MCMAQPKCRHSYLHTASQYSSFLANQKAWHQELFYFILYFVTSRVSKTLVRNYMFHPPGVNIHPLRGGPRHSLAEELCSGGHTGWRLYFIFTSTPTSNTTNTQSIRVGDKSKETMLGFNFKISKNGYLN